MFVTHLSYCSLHLHWNSLFSDFFLYKFVLYITKQIYSLCSVRSWKYIQILQNNLHVMSYCYKLSYEFKKLVNAKMLFLMAPFYSQCTYRMCVFHVASGDKIPRNVHWLVRFWCLPLLCILLNSNYCCRVQVELLEMVLLTGRRPFCKWKAIYIAFPA